MSDTMQSLDQLSQRGRQLVACILEQGRHPLGHVADASGHDQSELAEQATNLVALRGARLHEALSHPVQREHGLLLDALDRHEAHVRSPHRFADRLGVGDIVLVALHVGFDELR